MDRIACYRTSNLGPLSCHGSAIVESRQSHPAGYRFAPFRDYARCLAEREGLTLVCRGPVSAKWPGTSPAICFWQSVPKGWQSTAQTRWRSNGPGEARSGGGFLPDMRAAASIISCTANLQTKMACLRAFCDSTAFGTQILRIRDWYYAFFAQLHRNIISFAAHHEVLSYSLDSLGFSEPDQEDDYHDTR